MVRRGYSRDQLLRTPYAQVMLEWDAALFQETVENYDAAMARINHLLDEPSNTQKGKEARSKVVRQRRELIAEFHARAKRFWYGSGA